MTYFLRQKFALFTDDFEILDASGQPVYRVWDASGILNHQLSIQDSTGKEVARIEELMFSGNNCFNIFIGGERRAAMDKEAFTFFTTKFRVDVPGPNDLDVTGDFWGAQFDFKRQEEIVATVRMGAAIFVDHYQVDINPGEDDLLILAGCLVIDLACHDNHRR